jgi:hypothetical protein
LVASIVGFGISIWTLIVATVARRAAREAREAVRMGSAAEEFKRPYSLADRSS